MSVRASRVLSFLYWFFMRGKDEEQAYQMDHALGMLPQDVVVEHDMNVVTMAGGEIG